MKTESSLEVRRKAAHAALLEARKHKADLPPFVKDKIAAGEESLKRKGVPKAAAR